jgi:transposase InsO family protein
VLPFYEARHIPVGAVLTDNGREFCGTESHPFELYLALNEIEHRRTKVRKPQTNGFVERFNRTVLDEFFRTVFRTKFYESVEQLQADLDEWLAYYNHERPHQAIDQQIPDYFDRPKAKTSGKIKARAILGERHTGYSCVAL